MKIRMDRQIIARMVVCVVVRLSLLFLWIPVGLPLLAATKMKNRGWIGTLYFFAWTSMMINLLTIYQTYTVEEIEFLRVFYGFPLLLILFLYHCCRLLPNLFAHLKRKKELEKMGENINFSNCNAVTNQTSIHNQTNILQQSTPQTKQQYNVSTTPPSAYKKANFLTYNEQNYYEIIRLIAEKHNYNVLSKVRFADIVNVDDNVKKDSVSWWNKFNKISQKHIDFALADKSNLEIKLLIEVDDLSHQRMDRIERDEFVDSVCNEVGIPILHITDMIGLEEKILNILELQKTTQEM